MNIDSLDSLLEKLNSGDSDAAEQAFLDSMERTMQRYSLPERLGSR